MYLHTMKLVVFTFFAVISINTVVSAEKFQVATKSNNTYALLSNGNSDYPYNDIVYWNGPLSGCAQACSDTEGCIAYTLHKDNGANCWLKRSVGNPTPNRNRDTYQLLVGLNLRHSVLQYENLDYPGNDILYWKGPFYSCDSACGITPGCVAFTLHKDNGANCWLKSKLGVQYYDSNRNTFKLIVTGETPYSRFEDVNYYGNDIMYWEGPFTECFKACDKTPGCIAFTLDKTNGANCWLKNKLGESSLNVNTETWVRNK